jgi:hypothetical protein
VQLLHVFWPIFVLTAIQAVVFFDPPPSSDRAAAIAAHVSYFGNNILSSPMEMARESRSDDRDS